MRIDRANGGAALEWTRRGFLRIGALPGLALPTLLQAAERSAPDGGSFGRAKRCVFIFLSGGPPQHDTWDPKPDAPDSIRGELGSIATNVPDTRVGELFPRMARLADRCCVLRSVTHSDLLHSSAGYGMLTGRVHADADKGGSSVDRRPLPTDHPHLGSLLAKVRRPRPGVPTYAALPEWINDSGISIYPGQFGGLLGRRYDPYLIEGHLDTARFRMPDLVLPTDVDNRRLDVRRRLLRKLDWPARATASAVDLDDFDAYQRRAFDMLNTQAVRDAFSLHQQPQAVRDSYGPHLFGQSCLMARRLLEAEVSLVSVCWPQEGPKAGPVWDTHVANATHLRTRLAAPADAALAGLLRDLDERGLLHDTLFVCLGEFGRSPRINKQAGRDHWAAAQSILLAGAGIPAGALLGRTDLTGGHPLEMPVSPADLFATFLHLLGVDPGLEIHDQLGRPHQACTGTPVRALCG